MTKKKNAIWTVLFVGFIFVGCDIGMRETDDYSNNNSIFDNPIFQDKNGKIFGVPFSKKEPIYYPENVLVGYHYLITDMDYDDAKNIMLPILVPIHDIGWEGVIYPCYASPFESLEGYIIIEVATRIDRSEPFGRIIAKYINGVREGCLVL